MSWVCLKAQNMNFSSPDSKNIVLLIMLISWLWIHHQHWNVRRRDKCDWIHSHGIYTESSDAENSIFGFTYYL